MCLVCGIVYVCVYVSVASCFVCLYQLFVVVFLFVPNHTARKAKKRIIEPYTQLISPSEVKLDGESLPLVLNCKQSVFWNC